MPKTKQIQFSFIRHLEIRFWRMDSENRLFLKKTFEMFSYIYYEVLFTKNFIFK